MAWNAADMPSLAESRVVVTGANSGIGLEATREFARAGATVVMACRSRERAETAAGEIYADVGDATLEIESLDLASLESIREFVDRVSNHDIDVLVNNAGVMAIPRGETEDGFERQIGINHLGHFALTGLVFEDLAPGSRVVTVSSAMHERGEIDFEDLHGEVSYGPWDAYSQSKLANVLFARELDRRIGESDRNVTSVAAHPGYADTDLQARVGRSRDSKLRETIMDLTNVVFAQSAERGALPTLYAATAADVRSGEYYGPDGLLGMRGFPEPQQPSRAAQDPDTAQRLWERSVQETGVTYPL